jgi:hypothetical protein
MSDSLWSTAEDVGFARLQLLRAGAPGLRRLRLLKNQLFFGHGRA